MNPAVALRPEGARASSRQHTRRRLLIFGRRAFARKGHAGTNLKEDILLPAGVSVGSFYHQFRDKTDLFLAILREHSETFRAMIREAHGAVPSGAPGTVARHSFATVFRVAEANDDLFRIMVRERQSHDARVRAYLRDDHREWITSLADDYRRMGLVPTHAAPAAELAAELVSALTAGVVLRYLDYPLAERRYQRRRLIDGLVQLVLAGVPALVTQARRPRPPTAMSRRKRGGR